MDRIASKLVAAVLAGVIIAAPAAPALADQRANGGLSGLPPTASAESVGFSGERLKRLDAAMAKVVANGEVAGMTTYLARHGKVVAFNTYGQLAPGKPMTRDAIFRIYSMSKPITGVALMMLFEEGKFRLDDPVTRYIPEFKALKVMTGTDSQGKPILEDPKTPITIRQLMSHTAGFGYGIADDNYVDQQFREQGVLTSNGLQTMIEKVARIPLASQPGERWYYSIAVDIQGYLVEKLSGQPFGQFLDERLFTPLKMVDTGFYTRGGQRAGRLGPVFVWDPVAGKLVQTSRTMRGTPMQDFTQPPSMESGGGGLVSTTTDYARFCQMILNGGELDGVRILSPATIELMRTHVPASVPSAPGVGFGLDFRVLTDPRAAGSLVGLNTMSWGGAAGTWFWIDPTNDLVFVGMIQRMGASPPNTMPLDELSRTLVYQALIDPAK